jgi:hypothetical protein
VKALLAEAYPSMLDGHCPLAATTDDFDDLLSAL